MANQFVKQVGQSAADTARKMAKQMLREPLEIAKTAKVQLAGEGQKNSEQNISAPPSAAPENIPKISKPDEVLINANALQRLAELQDEVGRLIAERNQKGLEWTKMQNQEMGMGQATPEDKRVLNQPSTKRKTGFMGPAKSKQGTKEIGKNTSG